VTRKIDNSLETIKTQDRTAGDVPLGSHGELSTWIERDLRSAADDDVGM
jgi:hypothetical protein